MRDLLSVSSWRPQQVLNSQVCFDLDAECDSELHPRQWYKLDGLDITGDEPKEPSPTHHLFPFSEIGVQGILKWFDICTDSRSSRTVQTLILLLNTALPLSRRIQLLGGAIDGLYHYSQFQLGKPPHPVGFETACQSIRKHVNSILGKREFPSWAHRMAENYHDSKHADKHYVGEEFEELQTLNEGLFICRVFLAKTLGVDSKKLKRLIKYDSGNPRSFRYSVTRDPAEDWL